MSRRRGGFNKGGIYTDVLFTVCFLLILILPLFAYLAEKYLTLNSLQIAGDAIDASCMSAYNALSVEAASQNELSIDKGVMDALIKSRLCENLKLNPDMTPEQGSIAAGKVIIESAELYLTGFPVACSGGRTIRMPSFHIIVRVPLNPGLFRRYIINQHTPTYIRIHRDYEVPVT